MGYYGIHILEMLIRLLFPFVFVDMSVHLSVSLHLFTLYSLATCLSKKNSNNNKKDHFISTDGFKMNMCKYFASRNKIAVYIS